MANDEMKAILTYLANQGEGVAKTVREITEGTGLTSLAVRKRLAKSAKDAVPLVEIGKTDDKLDGYKLTSYGLASLDEATASSPAKKASKPAAKQAPAKKAPQPKKVAAGNVTVEKSDVSVIEHKIAAYLVKEGKKKPVFRIAQDISENQDDVEKTLAKMDSAKALDSELMADFNERVYQANEKTKALASTKPAQQKPKAEATPKSTAKTETKPADVTAVDDVALKILKKEKEIAGKALIMKVVDKVNGLSNDQVENRIAKLVTDGTIAERPKGRGKTFSLPGVVEAAEKTPVKRAAKKAASPSVGRKPQQARTAAPASSAAQGGGLGSEISGLMEMLEKSLNDDLTSAGPHASDALEKVREYMNRLEDEVLGWRKLASTFVTGAKGIVE